MHIREIEKNKNKNKPARRFPLYLKCSVKIAWITQHVSKTGPWKNMVFVGANLSIKQIKGMFH